MTTRTEEITLDDAERDALREMHYRSIHNQTSRSVNEGVMARLARLGLVAHDAVASADKKLPVWRPTARGYAVLGAIGSA